jgi:hypothetical protein
LPRASSLQAHAALPRVVASYSTSDLRRLWHRLCPRTSLKVKVEQAHRQAQHPST